VGLRCFPLLGYYDISVIVIRYLRLLLRFTRDLLVRHQVNHKTNATEDGSSPDRSSERAIRACDACVKSKLKCGMLQLVVSQRHQWTKHSRGSIADALKETNVPAKDVRSVASRAQANRWNSSPWEVLWKAYPYQPPHLQYRWHTPERILQLSPPTWRKATFYPLLHLHYSWHMPERAVQLPPSTLPRAISYPPLHLHYKWHMQERTTRLSLSTSTKRWPNILHQRPCIASHLC